MRTVVENTPTSVLQKLSTPEDFPYFGATYVFSRYCVFSPLISIGKIFEMAIFKLCLESHLSPNAAKI